ncbi:MAG: hypothetical protein RLY86_1182, partial [Pseudomonadota bacterium]
MDRELPCTCHWQGRSARGTARLDGTGLRFAGDFTLVLERGEIRAAVAGNGRLSLTTTRGTAALDLGEQAAAWAAVIRA